MHMADALISPAVGGSMWLATTSLAGYSIKKLKTDIDEKKIPLMGVMGAFVFAAQMINFSIPGTGSSGHIGGGLLLAIVLGPYAGFLTMASVLAIQALFFADGGLLALGCNIFNLGFYTCFIAYPLIYKKIIIKGYSKTKILLASVLASVIGLQLGSFSVVLQTLLSGKTELPFTSFTLLMQPIHLIIGIIEGLIITAIIGYIWKARPEILKSTIENTKLDSFSISKVLVVLISLTLIVGGLVSWFASENPDGLEWAMFNVYGEEELEAEGRIYKTMETVQEKTAFLPDYSFKSSLNESESLSANSGTSISGIIGGGLTLLISCIIGFLIKKSSKRKRTSIVS